MKKNILLSLAAALLLAGQLCAADDETEFYLQDDLTVKGLSGTQTDPDLEVKGFTVFGSTNVLPVPMIAAGAGNVVVNGNFQAVGYSTFSAALSVIPSTLSASAYVLRVGTSADSYLLTVTSSGWIGFGTNSPVSPVNFQTDDPRADISLIQTVAGSSTPYALDFGKRRGWSVLQPGDEVMRLGFFSYDNNPFPESGGYSQSGGISGYLDGAIGGPGDVPGRLEFQTTPDGTAAPVTRLTIKSDGAVGIGTSTPRAALDVVSTITAGGYAQIWRNSDGDVVASMTASGQLTAGIIASSLTASYLRISTSSAVPLLTVSSDGVVAGDVSHSSGAFFSVIAKAPPAPFLNDHYMAMQGYVYADSLTSADLLGGGSLEASAEGGNPDMVFGSRAAVQAKNSNPKSMVGFWVDGFGIQSGSAQKGYAVLVSSEISSGISKPYSYYSMDPKAVSYFAGPVGIGTDTMKGLFTIYSTDTVDTDWMMDLQQVGGSRAPGLITLKTNGTPEAKTDVTSGEMIFTLTNAAYAGSDGRIAAALETYVDGNPGAFMPARMELKLGDGQQADPQTRLVVKSSGRVGLSTGTPQALLDMRALTADATEQMQVWRSSTGVELASMSASGLLQVRGIVAGDYTGGVFVDTESANNFFARLKDRVSGGQDAAVAVNAKAGSGMGVSDSNDLMVAMNAESELWGSDHVGMLGAQRLAVRKEGSTNGAIADKAIALLIDDVKNDAASATFGETYGVLINQLSAGGLAQTNAPYALYSKDPAARTYLAGNLSVGISSATPYMLRLTTSTGAGATVLAVSTGAANSLTDVFRVDDNGEVYAKKFHGDAAGLQGVPGDNLGNHVASTTLNMNGYGIQNSGAVGIGVVSPSTQLHIKSADSGYSPQLRLDNTTMAWDISVLGGVSEALLFQPTLTAENDWLFSLFANTGKVGVGVYPGMSSAKLHVHNNNAYSSPANILELSNGASSSSPNNVLLVTKDGMMSLGATAPAPQARLHVAGSIRADGAYIITGSTVLAVRGTRGTSVGVDAGMVNTGANGLFVGDGAGKNNTADRATFIGADAGNANTTGINNTYLGYGAGYLNTTGAKNTALGAYAAWYNVTGSANALFGQEAGMGTGVGQSSYSSSTLMGYQAGFSLQNGSAGNTFYGYKAGYGVNTGTGNIVIGFNQDTSAPGANNELNIGGLIAGRMDQSSVTIRGSLGASSYLINGSTVLALLGAKSVSIGVGAAADPSSNEGVFVGNQAGAANTGQNNTFVGYQAGMANVGGQNNTYVGDMTAKSATGSQNTIIGQYAGAALGAGDDNVLLGWSAASTLTSGTGNIAIGKSAALSATSASNELNIGGLIRGRLLDGGLLVSTTPAAPMAALEVVSTGTSHDTFVQIWRNANGVIVSSLNSAGWFSASTFNAVGSAFLMNGQTVIDHNLNLHVASLATDTPLSIANSEFAIAGSSFTVGGSTLAVANGRVGIGTNNPQATLDVDGIVRFRPRTLNLNNGQTLNADSSYLRINGNALPATLNSGQQINPGVDGQRLVLEGTNDSYTVTLPAGGNLKLANGVAFTLGRFDTIEFIYNANDGYWVELHRANN